MLAYNVPPRPVHNSVRCAAAAPCKPSPSQVHYTALPAIVSSLNIGVSFMEYRVVSLIPLCLYSASIRMFLVPNNGLYVGVQRRRGCDAAIRARAIESSRTLSIAQLRTHATHETCEGNRGFSNSLDRATTHARDARHVRGRSRVFELSRSHSYTRSRAPPRLYDLFKTTPR